MNNVTPSDLLIRLEAFYDAVPRRAARAEEHGALRLFLRNGPGHPYYARPAGAGPVTRADVEAMRARQREAGVPEAFEWITDLVPSLTEATRAAGLAVHLCPLLVLGPAGPAGPATVAVPPGIVLRPLDPDTDALAADVAREAAVAGVAFTVGGTAVGTEGAAARDAALRPVSDDRLTEERAALRAGALDRVLALEDGEAVASASAQRAGDVVEIVGVATLPTHRRRGLAAAVTAALCARARAGGADLVFLSAQSEEVARVYGRLGFRRVATAGIAEPAGD